MMALEGNLSSGLGMKGLSREVWNELDILLSSGSSVRSRMAVCLQGRYWVTGKGPAHFGESLVPLSLTGRFWVESRTWSLAL